MQIGASPREASLRVHPIHNVCGDSRYSIKIGPLTSSLTGNGREERLLDISSESDDDVEELLLLCLLKRKLKRRSVWVRPIFSRRRQQGEYHNLLQEMRLSDPDSHFRYLRLSRERFDCLLSLVCLLILVLFFLLSNINCSYHIKIG